MRLAIALSLVCVPAFFGADWKPADSPLTTPWTEEVNASHPLPEYPRPQMARKDWINLNGLWDYAIRPETEATPATYDGRILVPYPVESALSGVKQPLKPDQRLWYRRTFTAPNLKGKRLLLHFGAVDWRAEVWVNGKPVGTIWPVSTNALRYNTTGGWLTIETGMQAGSAILAVSNPGLAVPASQLARLFQPFQRLDGQRTRHPGHGLGLAIVRAIAAAHGAAIQARPGQAGGLDIEVRFAPAAEHV